MKVAIDARFLTHPQAGGFKTYTENLIAALARVDGENQYLLYLDREPNGAETVIKSLSGCSNFSWQVLTGSLAMVGMLWREQVTLRRQTVRDHVDLLHAPALTAPLAAGVPTVVTLHDMIWRFPEQYSRSGSVSGKRKLMEWYYRYVPEWSARRAAGIITVSEASRRSILEHLPVDAQRVWVTPEAAGPGFRPWDDLTGLEELFSLRCLPGQFLPEQYLLAIGSADPRKNLRNLVEAYALLPADLRQQFPLVIVWTHSFLSEELASRIQALGLASNVHFLHDITNQELSFLYSGAAAFIFPSLYEGFGLPLLEAMASGSPVAAANNSSIPEIVGSAALLFDERNPVDMGRVIQTLLEDRSLRSQLRQAGLERAALFSWERCARETIEVYRQVVNL